MPLTDEKKNGLRALIAKNPGQAERILSRARANGVSEDDIQASLPRAGESAPGSLGEMFQKSAVGQELQSAGEGFVQGMSAGIVDPRASKPETVNLPFFGKSSPSRGVGIILGGLASPIIRGAGSVGKAFLGGGLAGEMTGAGVTGAGIETVRELATDKKIDPQKIMSVAALDMALATAQGVAPSVVAQFKAWLSKTSEPVRNLVERFKGLPEVQAEAATLQKTSPLFNPEYQAVLKKKKIEQDATMGFSKEQLPGGGPLDPKIPSLVTEPALPSMPSVPPGSKADIGAIPTAVRKATNVSEIPLLPEHASFPSQKPPMGERPSEVQGFGQAAKEKTKQLTHEKAMADKQKFDREIELEYYKKNVEFIKKIEDASRKGEAIPPVVYDEYKKALGRMNQGKGQFESTPLPAPPEPKFPTSDLPVVSIPKTGSFDTSGRAQRLGGLPGSGPGFPTEDLNMSAVGGKKAVKPKPKSITKKK